MENNLLSYNEFKEIFSKRISEYLPDELFSGEIQITQVKKINGVIDGLSLPLKAMDDGKAVSMVCYMNLLYNSYVKSGDMESSLMDFATMAINEAKKGMSRFDLGTSDIKEKISFQLINTEQNRNYLMDIPHREYLDMSIVYRWVVRVDPDGVHSVVIDNDLAEKFGLTEEMLYSCAKENTERIFPPLVRSISEILNGKSFDNEDSQMMEICRSESDKMWVFTNQCGVNGAGVLLYDDIFHELAMRLNSDLYILPSSIHEVLAVSAEEDDLEYLSQMVTFINMSQVALGERLSNQVYHYDRMNHTLSIASENPQRRLDGSDMILEPVVHGRSRGR